MKNPLPIRSGLKNSLNTIQLFLSMFPNGQTFHIIRDPRDVVTSFKYKTFEKAEKYLDAVFATMHSMDSAILYKQFLPKDKYFLIKYEDLVVNPENTARSVCEFLHIEFSQNMVDKSTYTDKFGKPFDSVNWSSFSSKDEKVNKIPIGKWKDKLPKVEILIVEALLKKQMEYFGYESSCNRNPIYSFISILNNNPILWERFNHFMNTGEGMEKYPVDPRNPINWRGDEKDIDITTYKYYIEKLFSDLK